MLLRWERWDNGHNHVHIDNIHNIHNFAVVEMHLNWRLTILQPLRGTLNGDMTE